MAPITLYFSEVPNFLKKQPCEKRATQSTKTAKKVRK